MLKKLRYLDYYILVPYLLLSGIGVVMVYSASAYWIQSQYHQADDAMMLKQLIFACIGVVLVAFFFYFKIKLFRRPGFLMVMWLALFVMLGFLLVAGHSVNGAAAWIPIGPFHLQPTEFAKLAVILYLAYMFTQRQDLMRRPDFSLKQLAKPLFLVAFCILLVGLEPDIGGAVILIGITLIMLASSGIALRYGLSWAAGLAALVGGLYWVLAHVTLPSALTKYYQVKRLEAAIHPFAERKQAGLQVVNSLLAINHGGFFGVGLGNGTQKLGYLPEPQTDFILAVIAEELGLIGVIVVIGLIFFLIMRFYLIGIRSKDPYRSLLAYGVATMMLIQTIFNVGAVAGVVPVTGVTLPFVSYGGSSLLMLAISVGIMLNISAQEKVTLERTLADA